MSDPKIIVALDYPSSYEALSMADQIDPNQARVKVGKELFTRSGPDVVKSLVDKGFDVFLDLKYHDIPNTVAKACLAAAELNVWMVNLHASGGSKMMETAKKAIADTPDAPLLIAVTILTSMDQTTFEQLGFTGTISNHVLKLASLTKECGLDGVVCSANESTLLKQQLGSDFKLITPGIRPADSAQDDQHRTMTPQQAITAGSDYLVLGRPITAADNPMSALQAITDSLQ